MPNLILSEPIENEEIVNPAAPSFKIFTGVLKAFEKDGDVRKYLSCTASSTVKDLHGDEMTAECVMGMAPQAKSKGMTIFLNHSYKFPEDVFGKSTDARIVSRGNDNDGNPIYDLDLEIQLNEVNPRANETYASIKDQGMKAGVSIGAMIEDYEFIDEEAGFWGGLRIKEVNLLEASIVGIPANQRSWVVNALKALGAPKGVIQKALGRGEPDVAKPEAIVKVDDVVVATAKSSHFQVMLDGVDITDKVKFNSIEDGLAVLDGAPDPEIEDSAAPDGESQTESADADDPADDEATTGAVDPAKVEAAVASLRAAGPGGELLEVVLGLLEGATEEVVSLRGALKISNDERDKARQDVLDAAEIVETIARTPLGRKTHFTGPVDSFRKRYGGYYDEGFLRLLDERNTE